MQYPNILVSEQSRHKICKRLPLMSHWKTANPNSCDAGKSLPLIIVNHKRFQYRHFPGRGMFCKFVIDPARTKWSSCSYYFSSALCQSPLPSAGFYNQLEAFEPPISPAILRRRKKNLNKSGCTNSQLRLNRIFETRIRSCGDTIIDAPLTLRISSNVLGAGVWADVEVDIAHTN